MSGSAAAEFAGDVAVDDLGLIADQEVADVQFRTADRQRPRGAGVDRSDIALGVMDVQGIREVRIRGVAFNRLDTDINNVGFDTAGEVERRIGGSVASEADADVARFEVVSGNIAVHLGIADSGVGQVRSVQIESTVSGGRPDVHRGIAGDVDGSVVGQRTDRERTVGNLNGAVVFQFSRHGDFAAVGKCDAGFVGDSAALGACNLGVFCIERAALNHKTLRGSIKPEHSGGHAGVVQIQYAALHGCVIHCELDIVFRTRAVDRNRGTAAGDERFFISDQHFAGFVHSYRGQAGDVEFGGERAVDHEIHRCRIAGRIPVRVNVILIHVLTDHQHLVCNQGNAFFNGDRRNEFIFDRFVFAVELVNIHQVKPRTVEGCRARSAVGGKSQIGIRVKVNFSRGGGIVFRIRIQNDFGGCGIGCRIRRVFRQNAVHAVERIEAEVEAVLSGNHFAGFHGRPSGIDQDIGHVRGGGGVSAVFVGFGSKPFRKGGGDDCGVADKGAAAVFAGCFVFDAVHDEGDVADRAAAGAFKIGADQISQRNIAGGAVGFDDGNLVKIHHDIGLADGKPVFIVIIAGRHAERFGELAIVHNRGEVGTQRGDNAVESAVVGFEEFGVLEGAGRIGQAAGVGSPAVQRAAGDVDEGEFSGGVEGVDFDIDGGVADGYAAVVESAAFIDAVAGVLHGDAVERQTGGGGCLNQSETLTCSVESEVFERNIRLGDLNHLLAFPGVVFGCGDGVLPRTVDGNVFADGQHGIERDVAQQRESVAVFRGGESGVQRIIISTADADQISGLSSESAVFVRLQRTERFFQIFRGLGSGDREGEGSAVFCLCFFADQQGAGRCSFAGVRFSGDGIAFDFFRFVFTQESRFERGVFCGAVDHQYRFAV